MTRYTLEDCNIPSQWVHVPIQVLVLSHLIRALVLTEFKH